MTFRSWHHRAGTWGTAVTAYALTAAALAQSVATRPAGIVSPATGPAAPGAAAAPAATQPAGPVVAMASVEAFWSADQYAKISGYLAEVRADIGDRVTKGQ